MPTIDTDTIDELNEPVCTIADLRPDNDWPNEVKALVAQARKVKKLFGFEVVTFSLEDSGGDVEVQQRIEHGPARAPRYRLFQARPVLRRVRLVALDQQPSW